MVQNDWVVQIKVDIGTHGAEQNNGNNTQPRPMDVCALGCIFHNGLVGMLLARGNDAENRQRGERAHISVKHLLG